MSRRLQDGTSGARIRENSRLMRTHESVVDLVNGQALLGLFAGLDFLIDYDYDLGGDDCYSDNEDDYFNPHAFAHRPLQPHPQIKQLTDEEADKHAEELLKEKQRQEKTEKNKRKKLRKKEKKRLEKESGVKAAVLAEEERGRLDPSESRKENPVIAGVAEANKAPESGQTRAADPVGSDEGCCDNNDVKQEITKKMTKEENERKKDLDLNDSCSPKSKLVPKEMCTQKQTRQITKEEEKSIDTKQSKETKPKAAEKPEATIKKENHESNTQATVDLMAEEFEKSRELAGIGNRLAASGAFEMAVKYFTEAIKHNPTEYKLFGNRSLCYERLQQYENACRDADVALSMEPKWIKGLFRKGKALCGLKKYYEASLIYKDVLELDSSSVEAAEELKRAQMLHLEEMGFSSAVSSEALKTHGTLEGAVAGLLGDRHLGDANARKDNNEQLVVLEESNNDIDEGEWIVKQTSRSRTRASEASGQSRWTSPSPTPRSKNLSKPELFAVWVGLLAPTVNYATLHNLFSRTGTVYSIKMLLEQQCAFINYTSMVDCERAIQCLNGMVLEGAPLLVRYPYKIHTRLGMSESALTEPHSHPSHRPKECFFWRTTGCTRSDCTFKHDPKNKGIDREKFTSRLGNFNV